jgi:hypothetical protein
MAALITKKIPLTFENFKIKISTPVSEEIKMYLEFAELEDDTDLFFEEAAKNILKKDKEFQKHLKNKD